VEDATEGLDVTTVVLPNRDSAVLKLSFPILRLASRDRTLGTCLRLGLPISDWTLLAKGEHLSFKRILNRQLPLDDLAVLKVP
jgi:hypothetical protein